MANTGKQIGRAIGYGAAYIGGQVAGAIGVMGYAGYQAGKEMAASGQTLDASAISERSAEILSNSTGLLVFTAFVITMLFLAIFFLCRKKNMAEEVNLRKAKVPTVLVSAVIGVCCYFCTVGALSFLPESILEGYGAASSGLMSQSLILAILGNVVAAPILEEIIFRGLIFDRLRKGMPVVLAAIIASICFGLAHGQLVWICYTFVIGLILCYIMHKSNSILPSIAAHMGMNGFSTWLNYSGLDVTNVVVFRVGAAIAVAIMVVALIISVKKKADEPAKVELVNA